MLKVVELAAGACTAATALAFHISRKRTIERTREIHKQERTRLDHARVAARACLDSRLDELEAEYAELVKQQHDLRKQNALYCSERALKMDNFKRIEDQLFDVELRIGLTYDEIVKAHSQLSATLDAASSD